MLVSPATIVILFLMVNASLREYDAYWSLLECITQLFRGRVGDICMVPAAYPVLKVV